jgi:hypothetical protein
LYKSLSFDLRWEFHFSSIAICVVLGSD